MELSALESCVEEGEEPKYGTINVGDLYISRILPARSKHPTSIKYKDIDPKEWKYDLLLT